MCVASLLLFSVGCGDTSDNYIVECEDSVLDEICDGYACVVASGMDTNSITSIDTVLIEDGSALPFTGSTLASPPSVNSSGELILSKLICESEQVTRVNIHITYK